MRTSILLAASLALAGCVPTAEDDATSAALQGGNPDSGDPAVGMLFRPAHTNGSADLGDWCTGTVIAPTIVLTAAHCVNAGMTEFYLGQGVPKSWTPMTPLPTPDPSLRKFTVVDKKVNPQWLNGGCPYGTSYTGTDTYDVALVRINAPAGVTPAAYATASSDEPAANASVTAVGYGWHGQQYVDLDIEAKRSGTSSIINVGTQDLEAQYSTAIADSGDSGGPIFYNGKIVGTTLCHTDGAWIDGGGGHKQEYYQRTDTVASFIAQATTQLQTDCDNSCAQEVGAPCGNDCFCISALYNCERKACGENHPIISCFPGF